MSSFNLNIQQSQSANVLAQAQVAVNAVINALQQVIAQASGNTVTLSAALLQSVLLQLNIAANLTAQARVQQQQSAQVLIGGAQATGTQMQIIEALAQVQAQINVVIQTFQQLLAQAQAMGGNVTISLAAAQQLLITLQVIVQAIVQIIAAQTQIISGGGAI